MSLPTESIEISAIPRYPCPLPINGNPLEILKGAQNFLPHSSYCCCAWKLTWTSEGPHQSHLWLELFCRFYLLEIHLHHQLQHLRHSIDFSTNSVIHFASTWCIKKIALGYKVFCLETYFSSWSTVGSSICMSIINFTQIGMVSKYIDEHCF